VFILAETNRRVNTVGGAHDVATGRESGLHGDDILPFYASVATEKPANG
jgi:hypothetical protein